MRYTEALANIPPTSTGKRWIEFLTHQYLAIFLAIIIFCLSLVSLNAGLVGDDFIHKAILLSDDGHLLPWYQSYDMFRFLRGDAEIVHAAVDKGYLPWWTDPNIHIEFFRPLSALSHWLDYYLWPESPKMMHCQSIALFALLIFLCSKFYRLYLGSSLVAGLAALLYAIDDAHGTNIGWLANRNAVIAGIFGMLALTYHHQWRCQNNSRSGLLALTCFILSLLSAEIGISTAAYIIAYELYLSPGKIPHRLSTLFSYAALSLLWYAGYRLSGFGESGSGLYISPEDGLLDVIATLTQRGMLLLFGQWSFPPSQIYSLLPDVVKPLALGWAIAIVVTIAYLLWPFLKASPQARFFAAGMILSLLPASLVAPDNRNLVFVGIGAMGLLSMFLVGWKEKVPGIGSSRLRYGLTSIYGYCFVLVHLILAPIAFPLSTTALHDFFRKNSEAPLQKLSEAYATQDKNLFFLNPPSPYLVSNRLQNGNLSKKTTVLGSSLYDQVRVERPQQNTLVLQPQEGFINNAFDQVYRDEKHPFSVGQNLQLAEVRITILSLTEDNRPLRVQFEFLDSMTSKRNMFIVWDNHSYRKYTLPDVGEADLLAGATLGL